MLTEKLNSFCELIAVSGFEGDGAKQLTSWCQPFCEEVTVSKNHSVVGLVRAPKEGEPLLLLDAHLDQIGLLVTQITEDGFLRVAPCGGIDCRGLLAKQLIFQTKQGRIYGVVSTLPPHLQKEEDTVPAVDQLFVDIGCTTKEEAEAVISVGDFGWADGPLHILENRCVSGTGLDDKAGCLAVFLAMEKLAKMKDQLSVGVAVCFTCQEEVSGAGAMTQAFSLEPDFAVSVDVSFAKQKDTPEEITAKLGGGPILAISPNMDRALAEQMKSLAETNEIPLQLEVCGRSTGTNGDHIAVSRGGVRTAVLSIPQKYMHTATEMVHLGDIQQVADLICHLATSLEKGGKE